MFTIDKQATVDRLNTLNGNDNYCFYYSRLRNACMLHATGDNKYEDTIINPLVALSALERADDETRNYGMPGLIF